MPRQIKFRAKRSDIGQWVYGHYFTTPLTDENSGTPPSAGWYFLTGERRHCISSEGVVFVVDAQTLGQSTGIKDKHGKDIFEGDIVIWSAPRNTTYIRAVEWMDDDAQFLPNNMGDPSGKYGGPVEVIGNIYEQPELLDSSDYTRV